VAPAAEMIQDGGSGEGAGSSRRSSVLARLWGPTERGFVPFIDEGLDAQVSVELRSLADGSVLWSSRGDHAGLELMM
jgi:hypothetical protein